MESSSEQGDGQVSLTGQSDSFFSLVVLFPCLVVDRCYIFRIFFRHFKHVGKFFLR